MPVDLVRTVHIDYDPTLEGWPVERDDNERVIAAYWNDNDQFEIVIVREPPPPWQYVGRVGTPADWPTRIT